MNRRYEMLDLMRTMANSIVGLEVLADHVADAAAQMEAVGQGKAADMLRSVARRHRVSSLEAQGQLAATGREYVSLYPDIKDIS